MANSSNSTPATERGNHPLNPLTPAEIGAAAGIVREWGGWTETTRFESIRLRYPDKAQCRAEIAGEHAPWRPLIWRASISEMVVPYGDPSFNHYRKNAFDVGEYGLGQVANPLKLGCDCRGHIHYFDGVFTLTSGEPVVVDNAVCLHEEDDGMLWKHTDYMTDETEHRRARKLLISMVATVGNYEYAFYWTFHLDGTLELEVKATGIMNTQGLNAVSGVAYGTEIMPGVIAPNHQHLVCARLDMAVDGDANRLVELNVVQPPMDESNPNGNAFRVEETVLESEGGRTRNADSERLWKVESASSTRATARIPSQPGSRKAGRSGIPTSCCGIHSACCTCRAGLRTGRFSRSSAAASASRPTASSTATRRSMCRPAPDVRMCGGGSRLRGSRRAKAGCFSSQGSVRSVGRGTQLSNQGVFRFIAFLVACAAPLGAAAQEPDRTDPPSGAVTVDVEALKTEIQRILDEYGIPGASIALVDRNRTIWAGGVGKADLAAGVDVTADHLFRIGSISKSFTALAALRALESGLLDLETPVRELGPEIAFTNPWEATHPVTVAMLMEHTTGFDDLHFPEWAVVDPEISLAEGLAVHPHSRVSRWRPGTHMSYSNSGPSVAASIVEKSTGTPFEEYVREQVFLPLGMETSTFYVPQGASLLAKGYVPDGVSEAPYEHIIMRPSGSLNASAREMARYLRMMINRGTLDSVRLLTPETVTRMETPTSTLAAREGVTHGDGLGNTTLFVNGHHFRGHGGSLTGFRSRSAYSSELGVGFFVSINKGSSGGLPDIVRLLGERLTEGLEKPRGPVAVLSDDELRAMTGSYQLATPRQQVTYGVDRLLYVRRIILEEGKLFLLPTLGGGRELVPVTATSFRFEVEPVATVFGGVDEEGNRILQTGRDGNYMRVGTARLRFQQAVALTTFLLLLSAPLFALVWAPARIFGRMKTIPLRTVLYPLLATLSIVVWFFLPAQFASSLDLGTVSGWSLTWFVGSLAFAALTALSLFVSFRRDSVEGGRLVRLHSRLVSLTCTVTLLYAWNAGWIGLRTWAY